MTQFRPQRGTLADALADAVKVSTKQELIQHLREKCGYARSGQWEATEASVTIENYGTGIDERCGWDTYIVCINGQGVGYTDGPPMTSEAKSAETVSREPTKNRDDH